MATYTPPAGDDVDFIFSGSYASPEGDEVDFIFGEVAIVTVTEASRSIMSDIAAFDTLRMRWYSSLDGEYRVEMGGNGHHTGDLMESGSCLSNLIVETFIDDTDVTTASGYGGEGEYKMNVYVKSADDVWNEYEATTSG